MMPGGIDMTDLHVEALLYGGEKVETEKIVWVLLGEAMLITMYHMEIQHMMLE